MNAEDKRAEIINRMLKASENIPVTPAAQSSHKPIVSNGQNEVIPEPIAIIGISGYLPKSNSVQEFWDALDKDKSLIEEIPVSRIDWETLYDPEGKDPNKSHTKWGGVIPDIRGFDPQFFGILPAEADLMDPRKRLLLMSVYHALEDAGYAPRSLKKNHVGVFVAIEEDEYRQCLLEEGVDIRSGSAGNSSSLIANQISYFFDFHGPSEVINTMCSGAAVAIHRAVGALRTGEISYAVVGAANILLHSDPFVFLSRTGQMSPTNTVYSFGKDACGFLRADGVSSIILKPLTKALEDNDAIYALIKNTAVNYNGQGGMSMAAPNISSHAEVIRKCYEESGIDPQSVTYIETQGMGNPVADIAEWEACNRALKAIAAAKDIRLKNGNCRISTMKPMTGHMHSASALGALFKIIRSLQTDKIHKILDFKAINPDLDVDEQPCRLVTETEYWGAETFPRLAGLHSYGSGGNNAHLLIEEFKGSQRINNTVRNTEKVIIPCSAETERQCREIVKELADVVGENAEYSIESIAYTLQTGRDAMQYRVAFVTDTREDFVRQARAYLEGKVDAGTFEGSAKGAPSTKHFRDIFSMAAAWVEGSDIPWSKTQFSKAVNRLHLPVYPFNCQPYWMEKGGPAGLNENGEGNNPGEKIRNGNITDVHHFPVSSTEKKNGKSKNTTDAMKAMELSEHEQLLSAARAIISETLSFFLKTSPGSIDLQKEFSAMGFDSLLVTNLRHRLEKQYNLKLESAVFFEHTTPEQLIIFIADKFREQLSGQVIKPEKTSVSSSGSRVTDPMEKEMYSSENGVESKNDPIAIIGLAGSFPQSPDIELFWKNIIDGNNCIEEVPSDRWSLEHHFHPSKEVANSTGRSYGKWGGFLKDLYCFDPLFFNISPSEAATMNPKERLFLQCAWHTLEDAGYTPQSLIDEHVGVFVGVTRSGLDPYKVSMFPVANRVSYTFNFRGPSMPVDTACSSSLVAVHEACQHIRSGECTVAIAGGVHAFLDPSHFSSLSSLQMLSPDGTTRSFGDEANGMVPGEGVGAIMLKPLTKAVADGDHIYGVIRGSATNHGGKANGFTVPNPKAHAALIRHALKKANINAREINYVEAHGTGTSLGDPIEIRGLTEAFRSDTSENQFCPIGSIKSNIGHLEASAGISGLAKILLQMKHGKLAPSIHSKKTNAEIDFTTTPFYVQQEVADWNPVDKDGHHKMRIACLSSFGAGGSNAHVIIEEYRPQILSRNVVSEPDTRAVILLSARNESRIKAQAAQLLSFLLDHNGPALRIHDIAYTLQTGREAMEERLAVEVYSVDELIAKLKLFIEGTGSIPNLYKGNSKKYKETVALLSNAEMGVIAEEWIAQQNYSKLLNLWVRGYSFNWNRLNRVGDYLPHRVSLPGYPFEKEYFGLPDASKKVQPTSPATAAIHPLVHQNISDFSEQKFVSIFTGEEFFLRDHIVHGRKFLPGVAYLEMVQAAMRLAVVPLSAEDAFKIILKNVAWIQPVAVTDQPVTLYVSLLPDENGVVDFEIYSKSDSEDTDNIIIHSQGTAILVKKNGEHPLLDIQSIRTLTNKACFSAENCYKLFDKIGIAYGPSHRGIEELFIGENEVLSRLSLPPEVSDTLDQFSLHPSLMDAAFQSIMGFMSMGREREDQLPLAVPFALEELTILDRCVSTMWAHIRYSNSHADNSGNADINNLSFDIDLCNDQGVICVQIRGFVSRLLKKGENTDEDGILFMKPCWEVCPVLKTVDVQYDQHVVLYSQGVISGNVHMKGIGLRPLPENTSDTVGYITDCTLQVFAEVQTLLNAKPKGKVLLQILIDEHAGNGMLSAISGLLKTAHMENPRFFGQLIITGNNNNQEAIISKLNECSQQPEDVQLRYHNGQRSVWRMQVHSPGKFARPIWKANSVYLVTGGAGGLGFLFAKEIALTAKGTVIILTGRSALTEEKKNQLEQLQATGATLIYRQVNVADEEATRELVKSIVNDFGKLNAVIHCAGVIRDNYIVKKDEAEIREVLAPKVNGLVNLDRATSEIDLDHFVVFSSVAGAMGNTAQSDYAVANAFMDNYVSYRNRLAAAGERKGTAVSINWPLWKNGGMGVDKSIEKIMKDTIGMSPLETTVGLRAFDEILSAGEAQMMVAAGNLKLLRKTFLNQSPDKSTFNTPALIATPNADEVMSDVYGEITERATLYFKKLLSGVIKLSPERIDADAPMEKYGIDSIMVMQMTNELEKVFGSLPKTLFFEYHNVRALTAYFLEAYPQKIKELLGSGKKHHITNKEGAPVLHSNPEKAVIAKTLRNKIRFALTSPHVTKNNPVDNTLDIAIIGLAGRYPQARNMEAFWDILKNGKNCITEVPKDRWDHSLYFDENKDAPGKTYTKWGGFVEGVDEFDPLFFNISPKEAEVMDPQERLFLQCAYEAIEDAGYTRETLGNNRRSGPGGNVGVYVGVMWEEYHLYAAQETILGRPMVLSSSPSSIANRVSYYLNLSGPSIAIDTMCSSSLTSIHLACQSLRLGECEVAIAGGVNVSIHPNKFLVLGYGHYASSKGLCESFGVGGDGYVAGEGVGAVLLKPLSKAIADKDQIYGVIKGTAVNHGGKANGFTVPNPRAQANVIEKAMSMAGFEARTISYMEAHGTGTALGDPIEFAGLCKAFDSKDKKFCALGSVKSNIGHCESAAGISGVSKVLLQLKHRQLVPSLHSQLLNPNIDFEDSPFVVQQGLSEWKRPELELGGEVKQYPRRAGISSFGAGGSNAHVLIEEYIPEISSGYSKDLPGQRVVDHPLAIVLSARNEEQLKVQAEQLCNAIQRERYTDEELPDIAFTLQVGREAMDVRLAIKTNSLQDLSRSLSAFINGETGIEDLFVGKIKNNKDLLSLFSSDDDMEQTVDSWLRKKKYSKLLGLWVNGFDFNWEKLYPDAIPSMHKSKRISLPTYPFARNRYWPEIGKGKDLSTESGLTSSVIHPLVHRNTSTFEQQKFTSLFNGSEFFLSDHRINGDKLLPGVAYLEMVNEAMALASGQKRCNIKIENTVWVQPFIVNGHPKEAEVKLLLHDNGNANFEISSYPDSPESLPIIHSQGVAAYIEKMDDIVLDIDTFKESAVKIITAQECYQFYSHIGIAYGPAHQAIETIYIGKEHLLAELCLPDVIGDTINQFYLHPSLLDASLQAVIGFFAANDGGIQDVPLAIPYSIDSVQLFNQCTTNMWAIVRYHGTNGTLRPEEIGQLSFDIDVCDHSGKVCVRLAGFTSRILGKGAENSGNQILLIEPSWKAQDITVSLEKIRYETHTVILLEKDSLAKSISAQIPGVQVINLNEGSLPVATAFENYALQIFREIKRLLGTRPKKRILLQIVVPEQGERSVFIGLSGLLKTAHLENPLFTGQLIAIDESEDIISKLKEDSQHSADDRIRYCRGQREVFSLQEYAPQDKIASIWKDGGKYLITGGAGGVGLLFAKEIARNTRNVTLILTGRSPLNEIREKQVEAIRSLDVRIEYLQADISDYKSVQDLQQRIVQKYGDLNGVIHSAGLLKDNYILKKSEPEIRQVFAPKVQGVSNLDRAVKGINLDFFIVCSSTAAVTGNAGQADYATANAWLDSFAMHRQSLVDAGLRHGKTLSMIWPLWKEGGMQISEENEKNLRDNFGMYPLETDLAFRALYQAMASPSSQMMVLQGKMQKLRSSFLTNTNKKIKSTDQNSTNQSKEQNGITHIVTKDRIVRYFAELLSGAIKLHVDEIDPEVVMEEYGIDSIMITRMTSELEKVFGSLSKTLFFEYRTIRELAEYFEEAFSEKLGELLGDHKILKKESLDKTFVQGDIAKSVKPVSDRFKNLTHPLQQTKPETRALDVAIIGLSGSYPQARDISSFWNVLKEGRNCISEIPESRWDHSQYFDKEKNKPGKTYARWGGFLEGVAEFDPLFFNISPKEAEIMDPQERLFLQCVYETFEDAGYTKEAIGSSKRTGASGNIGVYVGVMNEEYQLYGPQETALGRPLVLAGNSASIANRVSYFFNLHGPSIALNTMCSSSLSTVHLACQSLQLGECEAAIAGGVNVTVHPNKYLALGYGNFLSTKGICETFGAGGDGYVPGEGVGAVLLKPLAKAIEDKDHIYGVIKGTAVNHGGKTNGYTVPNPMSQENVISKAMSMAGFSPETISYLEAHGTGTALGDPIEITGLNKAFSTDQKQFCAIGSVKSNIGHCESAAGIAAITKVLLQMKYGMLVPSLHSAVLNPGIDFKNSPFVVQQELSEWKRPVIALNEKSQQYPRRAGISSFGAGGANAHILIEEYVSRNDLRDYDAPGPQPATGRPALVVLSARNFQQLKEQARKLYQWIQALEQLSHKNLVDMAYTLQVGREAMEERLAMEATSFSNLEEKLLAFLEGRETTENVYRGTISETKGSGRTTGKTENSRSVDIDDWHGRQEYGGLLNAWVKGLQVNWAKLYEIGVYGSYTPQRISLPTYSFARRRCWFDNAEGLKQTSNMQNGSSHYNASEVQQPLLLKKQWNISPIPVSSEPCKQVVILFSEETKEIATLLQHKLIDSLLVDIHDAAVFSEGGLPEHRGNNVDGFIDLIGCGTTPVDSMNWIKLLQGIIEVQKNALHVICATRGITAFQNKMINLAGATHTGLYRMLGSEYSHVISRHVDMDAESNTDELVKQILNELSYVDQEPEVCYRNGTRYCKCLSQVEADVLPAVSQQFSADQVILITGGTRGLGYLCASHFVQHHGARRLILSGQEELPPRDEWNKFLGHETGVARKIMNILALEAQGAEVKILAAPLTDKKIIDKKLWEIKQVWGNVHGVIHCAGIGDHDNPAFIRKSVEHIRTVMNPKVDGVNNLYDCLKEEPLAFFVLFSSVSAVIPALGAGQAAYAMGNAYMDHFAEAKSYQSPIVSIQWPNWKDTGMGEIKTKAYRQSGLRSLTDTQGLQALDLIIHNNLAPVILPAWVEKEFWRLEKLCRYIPQVKIAVDKADDQPVYSVGKNSLVSHALNSSVNAWLTDLFARELKLEPEDLRPDKYFQDYGIDSILITQLLQPIKKILQQDIDPSILYEYATIRSLADWLVENFSQRLSVIFKDNIQVQKNTIEEIQSSRIITSAEQASAEAVGKFPGNSSGNKDIAVVGMACRFPGAQDINEYWDLLCKGKSAIRTIAQPRWNSESSYTAGWLDDIDRFDSKFFFLHDEDVRAMDPQALLVLEETLKLFCHAGYTLEEIKGKSIGVYLGGRSRHSPYQTQLSMTRNPIMAVGQNYLAANVSQFFDLRGPGMVIDTACSSALVCMNMAIQALQDGEIESAVVGGVSLLSSEETHHLFRQRGILSEDKDFHLFDKRAKGIVLGEGVGMVLLKNMDQAIADGDSIYATIKSIAINNDGKTAGHATPNIEAQKEVMRTALAKCGKRPEEISYLEVNGSGSEVTDLLELKAINAVYSPSGSALGLGSIKPNIGHPLCAEGIAGFIKIALMVHHKQFVPFLSGHQPMKYFNIESSPFRFSRTLCEWPAARPVAAINCFADGGTNAHVIVEHCEMQNSSRRIPLSPPVLNRKKIGDNIFSRSENAKVPTQYDVLASVWETFN